MTSINQLNPRVATEVMGWHRTAGQRCWLDSEGKVTGHFVEDDWEENRFSPCEYISDAWVVVEHLQKMGVVFTIFMPYADDVTCSIYKSGTIETEWFVDDTALFIEEAICNAALKAMEKINDTKER